MSELTQASRPHHNRTGNRYWDADADAMTLALPDRPLKSDVDVLIIGAGLTGLSAALRLRESHGASVMVVDAFHPGWGASGRSGGFCGIGGDELGLRRIAWRFGRREAEKYQAMQLSAVETVRALCAGLKINAQISGEGVVTLAHRKKSMRALERRQRYLERRFKHSTKLLGPEEMATAGMASPAFRGGLLDPVGFGLQPLLLVHGLSRAARRAGAQICINSQVLTLDDRTEPIRLRTQSYEITAGRVLLATNAHTPAGIGGNLQNSLLPVLSSVLVTRPISTNDLQDQGWTSMTMARDTRRLPRYFRLLPGNRLLFGAVGGVDGSARGARAMQARLRLEMNAIFPHWQDIEHTHFWRGYACGTSRKVPFVGPTSRDGRVWAALGYHGGGIAMSIYSGRIAADRLAGTAAHEEIPAFLGRRPPSYLLPGMRPLRVRTSDMRDRIDAALDWQALKGKIES